MGLRPRDNGVMDEVTFSQRGPGDRRARSRPRLSAGTACLAFPPVRTTGRDRYGFVERGGVELHLSESPEHDRTRDGAEIYLYVSDADGAVRLLVILWRERPVHPHRTTRRTGFGSSPSSTGTELLTASDRRCRNDDREFLGSPQPSLAVLRLPHNRRDVVQLSCALPREDRTQRLLGSCHNHTARRIAHDVIRDRAQESAL